MNENIPYQKAVMLDNDRDAAEFMRRRNIEGQIKSVVLFPAGAA